MQLNDSVIETKDLLPLILKDQHYSVLTTSSASISPEIFYCLCSQRVKKHHDIVNLVLAAQTSGSTVRPATYAPY